jgi:hypothetical protein
MINSLSLSEEFRGKAFHLVSSSGVKSPFRVIVVKSLEEKPLRRGFHQLNDSKKDLPRSKKVMGHVVICEPSGKSSIMPLGQFLAAIEDGFLQQAQSGGDS